MPAASLDVGPDGQVGVAWTSGHEDEGLDVFYAQSDNQGLTYGTNHRVHPSAEGTQQLPDIAFDGSGTAHLFYESAAGPAWDPDIRYACTVDGGVTFTDPVTVNDDPEEETNLQEAVAAAGLPGAETAAVWMDGREGGEDNVYFTGPASAFAGIADDVGSAGPDRGPDRATGLSEALIRPTLTRCESRLWAARVSIFDAQGRCVRVLHHAPATDPGWLRWDGRDAAGRPVSAGIYHALLRYPHAQRTRRILVTR